MRICSLQLLLAEPVGAKLKVKTKFPIQSLQILDVPAIPKESTSIPTSEFARALEKFCALQFYDANTNYISVCFKSQEEKNEWYIAIRRVQTGSEDFNDLPGGVRATLVHILLSCRAHRQHSVLTRVWCDPFESVYSECGRRRLRW